MVQSLAIMLFAVAVLPLAYVSIWLSVASGAAACILAAWFANKAMDREFRKPGSPLRERPESSHEGKITGRL